MATISRLDHSATSMANRHSAKQPIVPSAVILHTLGTSLLDLGNETVTVNSKALRRLLSEFARREPFDPEFYADCYPDIEAARLAGRVRDLHEHFIETGFFEGRLPSDPPFDPVWYAEHYTDLAASIPPHDVAALRNHFLSTGLYEGRAGTAASLLTARPWHLE